MNELSVFVDESGDFGDYDYHAPYYIISLVLHDQSYDLSDELEKLENALKTFNYPNHCLHVGPIIRKEADYEFVSPEERQKLLKRLMSFTRHVDIRIKTVYIEKKHIPDAISAVGKLSKQLSAFIRENMPFFTSFDHVKVYYDNGQVEVTKIISSVFNSLLDQVEFRKVIPSEYRLFQVADLVCTMKLLELKMEEKALSSSELMMFGDERTIKKNYLKPLHDKAID